MRTSTNNTERTNRVNNNTIKVGDRVRHNWSDVVATVVGIRKGFWNKADGYVTLYKLDFGQSVIGPYQMEMNGGEYRREAITKVVETKPAADYTKRITDAAEMGVIACAEYKGMRIQVRVAYRNDSNNPDNWSYCVSYYQGKALKDCDNGVSLLQAAKMMADFERLAKDGKTLDEILYPTGDEPQPKNTSWATDYSADDFHKLTSRYEVSEHDRDIVGRRFVNDSNGLGSFEIFVSDYAGNESHALIYFYDEFMDEVRANVLPLSRLRQILTPERGWQIAA